jgi:DNA (cytosine-5)-methyltransferase 1
VRFLSVCSGIEAASVAWNQLGWKAAAFSEIEPFPCAVLAHHYPTVPNWGDMTKFQEWPDATVDLLCGGTPCQSFSVAGLRKGLADPRGNLMLTFGAIADRYRPEWLVWENVPGVLSSDEGRDFGAFLGMLGQLGYGFAYRVLDAQYFGLAQRRKRVFVVGCLGSWQRAAAVLFERHSLQGHPAPSRQAGQGSSYGFAGGAGDGIAKPLGAHALSKGRGTDLDNSTYVTMAFKAGQSESAGGTFVTEEYAPTLQAQNNGSTAVPAVLAFDTTQMTSAANRSHGALVGAAVRRLTPGECLALQGFPRDYLDITYRGKPAADGPKYKATGNSWAVPVVRWIGERIEAVREVSEAHLSGGERSGESMWHGQMNERAIS